MWKEEEEEEGHARLAKPWPARSFDKTAPG